MPAPHSAPRRAVVPVRMRPWRVLLVPADPAARTHTLEVARWQARLMIGAVAVGVLLSTSIVAAVVIAARTPDLFFTSSEVSLLRSELTATQDSLSQARASIVALAEADAAPADSAADLVTAAATIPPPKAPVSAPARPRPLAPARGESGRASITPIRSIEDLPVIGALASRFSRARRHPLLHLTRPHLGIDVAARSGTPVTAPAPGRVRFVGRKFGFGLVVELVHADGVMTRYAHLRTAAVTEGQAVVRGETIAAVGSSGITTGPHLHYEVLVHGRQVDPLRHRFPAPVPVGAATVAGEATAPAAGSAVSASHESAGAFAAPAPR